MTISVTKPSVNLREKLNELDFDRVPFQKMPAGSVVQVVTNNLVDTHGTSADGLRIDESVAYNNNAITPLLQATINPKQSGSHFLVSLTGNFHISNAKRSQILLSSNWVPGTAPYPNHHIWYTHFGIYNDTGGDAYRPGAYSFLDKHQNKNIGEEITYSWFGGSIGSGSQRYCALSMTVMEVAQ